MTEIDITAWERREVYEFYSRCSNPFYMVSFRADVTGLYDYVKSRGLSFYAGMIWACTQAVNATPAFLVAAKDGRPVRLDRRLPSFTDMRNGSEVFHIVTMDRVGDIDGFCAEAVRRSQAQQSFIDLSTETDDLIYFSCLPWVELTALTNERDLSAPGALDDAIPRIAWGKYAEADGRKALVLSVEVNHRFIDGVHIGRFAAELERIIRQLKP